MPGTIDDTIGNGGGVTFTAFQSEIVNTFQNFYLSDSDGFNNFINYDWQNSQYPADEAAQEVDEGGGLYPLFGQIAGGNFGIIFGTMADFFDWANGQ